MDRKTLVLSLLEAIDTTYAFKAALEPIGPHREQLRGMLLHALGPAWYRHLTQLEAIREGSGLQSYGQQDPFAAYQKASYEAFDNLQAEMQETVCQLLFCIAPSAELHRLFLSEWAKQVAIPLAEKA
jgi:preprotein translocase subunit SecA